MRWLEISVRADGEAAEAVSEVFNRFGHGGAVIEQVFLSDDESCPPGPPTPALSEGEGLGRTGGRAGLQLEGLALTVKTFLPINGGEGAACRRLEEALWHLGQLYPIPAPQVRELAEEDWAEAWKAGYGRQRIGQRIVIVPFWESYAPQAEEIIIRMEPGMAFGTGTHPTTRMCLAELERRVERGMRVLDVGTGSGVLAIAAAHLGAVRVLALDIDPTAVEVARANIAANGVDAVVSVRQGSLEGLEPGSRTWDLIVANILAEPIAAMSEDLAAALAPSGCLIASGIISDDESLVTDRFQAADLAITDRCQHRDWVTLVASHRRRVT